MNRDWKPGDVAMVRGVPCIRLAYGLWEHGRPDQFAYYELESFVSPLVVIDPENADDVAELVRLFWAHGTDDCDDPHAMQAALREYANPTPQIEEPTGLGAVVEDARGVRWVRTEPKNGMQNPWQATLHVAEPDKVRSLPWAEVCAVRKLSEGVTE